MNEQTHDNYGSALTFQALSTATDLAADWIKTLVDSTVSEDPRIAALLQRVADGARAEVRVPVNVLSGDVWLYVQDAAGEWEAVMSERFEIEELVDGSTEVVGTSQHE